MDGKCGGGDDVDGVCNIGLGISSLKTLVPFLLFSIFVGNQQLQLETAMHA